MMSVLPRSKKPLHPEKIEQIFSWCEKTFVEQTVNNFSQQIGTVLDEIRTISDDIQSYQEKQVYQALHQKLLKNKKEMSDSFGIFLKKYFEEKIIPPEDFDFDGGDLRIVSESELSNNIAKKSLENEMNKELGDEVKKLSNRMEFLLGKDTNPFSTDVLASALTSALEQILQDIAMQKQVVTLFSKKWPDSIKTTYEGMNHFLIDNDVLVELGASGNYIPKERKSELEQMPIRSPIFQQAFGKHIAEQEEKYRRFEEQNESAKANSETGGIPRINLPPLPKISHQDVVQMFSSIVNKNSGAMPNLNSMFGGQDLPTGRMGISGAMGHQVIGSLASLNLQPVSRQTYETIQELTQQLNDYSRVNTNSPIASGVVQNIIESGLGANSLQLTNILKSLPSATENQMDRTIIELVSVVFDNIFSLSNVPDHVKFLIGKLQIPILKNALNDKTFFTEKESPVRLFLNKITKKETAYNNASMTKFEEIIESILKIETITSQTFIDATQEIDSLIELETQKEDQIIEKSSPVLEQSEKCAEHLEDLIAYTKSMTDKVNYEPLKIFIEKIWAPHFAKKWSPHTPAEAENFVKGLKLEAKVQLNHGLIVFDMLFRSLVINNPTPAELEQLRVSIPKIRDGLNKICFDLRISNEDAQGLGFLLAEKHLFLIQREEEKRKIHQKNIQENESNIIENYKNKQNTQANVQKAEVEINASESNFNIIFVKGTWFGFKEEAINMKLLWVSPKRTLFLFSSPKDKKVYSFDKAVIWEKYKKGDVTMLPSDEIDTDTIIGNAVNDIAKR